MPRGFIRAYARLLELDPDEVLNGFDLSKLRV